MRFVWNVKCATGKQCKDVTGIYSLMGGNFPFLTVCIGPRNELTIWRIWGKVYLMNHIAALAWSVNFLSALCEAPYNIRKSSLFLFFSAGRIIAHKSPTQWTMKINSSFFRFFRFLAKLTSMANAQLIISFRHTERMKIWRQIFRNPASSLKHQSLRIEVKHPALGFNFWKLRWRKKFNRIQLWFASRLFLFLIPQCELPGKKIDLQPIWNYTVTPFEHPLQHKFLDWKRKKKVFCRYKKHGLFPECYVPRRDAKRAAEGEK